MLGAIAEKEIEIRDEVRKEVWISYAVRRQLVRAVGGVGNGNF